MESQVKPDHMIVWIKEKPEKNPVTSVSDMSQLPTVNAIKVEEFSQDYNWSEQLVSAEPGFVNPTIKTEVNSYCLGRSVNTMLIKEEAELAIPLEGNHVGGQKLFTCYHCNWGSTSLEGLRHHIKKRHKLLRSFDRGDDSLDGCITLTPNRLPFKKQTIKSKVKENTFLHCSYCDHISKTSTYMIQHMATHFKGQTYIAIEKEKPFRCPLCEFTSLNPQNLNLHIMALHNKSHRCPHCDYSTPQSGYLKRHIKIVHKREKPYQCLHCEYSTSGSGNLKKHIMSVHKKEKPYHCSHCDYSSSLPGKLKRHIMSVHKKEKPHQCPHCVYSSSEPDKLKRHIISVHKKERPHQCPHCDYSASQSGHLKRHIMIVHKREKHYQCLYCEYSASVSGNLKKHIMSVHKKEKPYHCSHCDYSSSGSGALKRHMSVHTKEKPHQCPHCDYSASQSGHIKRHIMIVHKRE